MLSYFSEVKWHYVTMLCSHFETLHNYVDLLKWLTVCLLQPDDTVNVAIEKINSLLENFLGISDTELGKIFSSFN